MKSRIGRGDLVVDFSLAEARQLEELLDEVGAASDGGAATDFYKLLQDFLDAKTEH